MLSGGREREEKRRPGSPHLLVVQPVPAYSPPVVAEVVLNGWIGHLGR